MESYDVVVVGLGAMGSSALRHAAKRGLKVLGIEQFAEVPHTSGSHHGQTRIIRKAYYEHPSYVPLILRAYELWDDLGRESDQTLVVKTGGLTVGPPNHELVQGAIDAATLHHLPYEELSRSQVHQRFPQFRTQEGDIAVFEPDAGYVRSEEAIRVALGSATRHGADVWLSTAVLAIRPTQSGVEIVTSQGTVSAEKCILTVGAWGSEFQPSVPLQVERQVCYWFDPISSRHALRDMPIFLASVRDRIMYGFPYIEGQGSKIAFHHSGEATTPDAINREVSAEEEDLIRTYASQILPDLLGARLVQSSACMYTNTPDAHFVIGDHPTKSNVIMGLGFSGHGFKFASVIGELLVQLARNDSGVTIPEIFKPQRVFQNQ